MSSSGPTCVVYDGECPFCSTYVRFVRLREAVGEVVLVDARGDHPILAELRSAGLDLDEGMAVRLGGRWYHGAECLHVLASLSGPNGLANRLNAFVFKSPRIARAAYPSLRFARNTALRLLGRSRIDNLSDHRARR